MTSQNQIPDDDLLEKWLDNPMTQEKKEELAKYREEYLQARKEAIEHKKNNEYWKFLYQLGGNNRAENNISYDDPSNTRRS
jgi:hypothetical protein